ncbi:C4-dicarboxylate ABC transporter [Salinarimonas ramus]|uniref:C4-dicarboxylate ABC transporter n=1 Tax=Salinarimonas ramus TaxID=690164 RepID=A0A917Q3N2_9HYPH|nr:C4-dicarboxylate ABC transporter [Salinarimonas ramus]
MAFGLCATPASAQETLRFAHFSAIADPNHVAAQMFADRIAEETDGRYNVEIFENSQLGGELEVVEGIQLGTVDVAPPSAAVLANIVPEMNLLNMPFLFSDFDHYETVLEGPFFDALVEKAAESGVRVLGMMTSGPRHIMTKFPVAAMADLEGAKIRTVQNPVHVATFTAFGANATAIAYPEVYGALQTGVVDGGDAANTNYYTARFYEVAPYWAQVSWLFYSNPIVMSEAAFQALSDEDKAIFERVGREVGRAQIEGWKESDARLLDELKAEGVTVTTPPREPFQEAVDGVYAEFLTSDFEKTWLDEIRAAR